MSTTISANIKTLFRAVALVIALSASMPLAASPRIHCAQDTVKARQIISTIAAADLPLGKRMTMAAKALIDTPRAASVENDSIGTMMISFHSFDPLDYINSVMALALGSSRRDASWRDYARCLEKVGRRKGVDTGFPSKLKYGAQWVVDNVYRGSLKDFTEYFDGSVFKTRTLDYCTRHRELFPALADSAAFEEQRMIEMGYRGHKVPHVKKQTASNKQFLSLLQEGDIIMMLANGDAEDVYDIGVVTLESGEPRLIHIGVEEGKVVEDPYPVARLFKLQNQHFYGFRWLRPVE